MSRNSAGGSGPDSPRFDLTHHFLIAMPGVQDSGFAGSIIYLCEHSEDGALGLVINKPSDIDLKTLFERVDLPLGRADLADLPVFAGGPVNTERGFVLHEAMTPDALPDGSPHAAEKNEPVYASTLSIPGGLEMTTSKDVLEALSHGKGPRKLLVSLGYSAWARNQLESELAANFWLTVHADPAVIFDTPVSQRYERALLLLGLQEAWALSPEAGHA
ncbi:MAG: YqgE/AlgH family protein [Burkholderiaceae bacterium]|nr:YqgE/AlgH family protein [Burkholderiaceae bacterium]